MKELLLELRGGKRGPPTEVMRTYFELFQKKQPWEFDPNERKIEAKAMVDFKLFQVEGLAYPVAHPGALILSGIKWPFSKRTLDGLHDQKNQLFKNAVLAEYGPNSGETSLYGKLKKGVTWRKIRTLFSNHEQRLNKDGHGVALFRHGRFFRISLSYPPERFDFYSRLGLAWHSLSRQVWEDWLKENS